MIAALDSGGNASSIHADGRAARRLLEDAREAIAAGLGGHPARLVFCSGGTEADALAVHGLACGRRRLVGATEHDAIRAAAPDAGILPVDSAGVIDLAALEASLAGAPALVCVMLANNETGTIQPIAAIAALCRRAGALLHVDAVQAAGRMPVDFAAIGADAMAVSAHKLGGPLGVGALLLSEAGAAALQPVQRGGGQEGGRRGGTSNGPAVAGFAAALASPALAFPAVDVAALRDRAETAALACGAVVAGAGAARLSNTSCLILPGVAAQTQLIALDMAGISVSAGAACSSGKVARSHVLEAMGLAGACEAIRVSLPWSVREADISGFIAAYTELALRTRRS